MINGYFIIFFFLNDKQVFKHLAFQRFRSSHQVVFYKKDILKSHNYCGSGEMMDVMVLICHLISQEHATKEPSHCVKSVQIRSFFSLW